MKRRNRTRQFTAIPALLAAAMLAGCQTTPPAPAVAVKVVDTREAMVAGINPAAIAIWDITNAAMDDSGEFDAALVDDAAWADIAEAAKSLEFYSHLMAQADELRAGGPEITGNEVPPGVATREEIQAMIDSDPAGYRAMSTAMGMQATALAAAAQAHDGAAVSDLVNRMDAACQTCHVRYWYKQP